MSMKVFAHGLLATNGRPEQKVKLVSKVCKTIRHSLPLMGWNHMCMLWMILQPEPAALWDGTEAIKQCSLPHPRICQFPLDQWSFPSFPEFPPQGWLSSTLTYLSVCIFPCSTSNDPLIFRLPQKLLPPSICFSVTLCFAPYLHSATWNLCCCASANILDNENHSPSYLFII